MSDKKLRIVTFNYNPTVFNLCRQWILANGHQHVLAVTTAGPKSRPTPAHKEIVANAPRELDVLVSSHMKSVVTPVVRALEPDLIFCYSFPYRLSAELCAIPKLGAVNVHPAALPAYRGPNAVRSIYDGAPLGVTMHWMAPEFDTGNILSVKSAPLPEALDFDSVFQVWGGLMYATIDEGMKKAIAGDAGQVQDESKATYSAEFSDEEYWLNLDDSIRGLQQKVLGLQAQTTGDGNQVKVALDGKNYVVLALESMPEMKSDAAVGACLEASSDALVVKVRDGVVKFSVEAE